MKVSTSAKINNTPLMLTVMYLLHSRLCSVATHISSLCGACFDFKIDIN